jgi:hypothetical protein
MLRRCGRHQDEGALFPAPCELDPVFSPDPRPKETETYLPEEAMGDPRATWWDA